MFACSSGRCRIGRAGSTAGRKKPDDKPDRLVKSVSIEVRAVGSFPQERQGRKAIKSFDRA
jgi:hypothetical protein